MSNFINNSAMTPNLQTQGDIPFLNNNNNNKQMDFQESDFSKALKAAAESRQKEERPEFSNAKKQEYTPSKDTVRESKSQPAEKPFQSKKQLNEQPQDASEKQPVTKPEQNENDQSMNTNKQSDAEETAKPVEVDQKNPETKIEPETEPAQASAVAQLLMEMVDGSQSVAETADIPVEAEKVDAVTEAGKLIDAALAANKADVKEVLQTSETTKPVEIAEEQKAADLNSDFLTMLKGQVNTAQVDQNQQNQQSTAQSTVQSTNSPVLETIQGLENQVNPNGVKTEKQQSIKNENSSDSKFADLVSDVAKDSKSVTSGTGSAESQQKNASQKDLLNSELAKAMNNAKADDGSKEVKDNNGASSATTVIQTAAKDGKPHSINLPLIQTQLSVNGNADKARTDIPVVQITSHQQNMQAASEVTGTATTNSLQRDELFAQIIDKAKIMVNNGHSEMEVSLKPDHLGKLHLKVSVDNQVVTAKFIAESQQVKEIIETHLNHLRRNLQETGVQVDNIMVSVGQQQNGGNFQETGNYHGGFNNGGNYSNNNEDSESGIEKEVPENRPVSDTLVDLIA